jgi:hypothetical protein
MKTKSRRLCAVVAAAAMLAVLSACMPPTPPTPPTPPVAGAPVERTIAGEVPPKESRWVPANCADVGFVQRGVNQTVPKLKLVLESPLWAFPIARDTEPNQFLSRNVTSMTIALGAVEFSPGETRSYRITYWCTSDKDQAWTVSG